MSRLRKCVTERIYLLIRSEHCTSTTVRICSVRRFISIHAQNARESNFVGDPGETRKIVYPPSDRE